MGQPRIKAKSIRHDCAIGGKFFIHVPLDPSVVDFLLLVSFHRSEGGAEHPAEPHGNHAEGDGQNDIAAGIKPFTFAQQIQGLQAERGERGVAASDADHQELRGEQARLRIHPAFGNRQRADDADDERAGDIDGERAPRKGRAKFFRDKAVDPEARHTAERAAQGDPKICEHKFVRHLVSATESAQPKYAIMHDRHKRAVIRTESFSCRVKAKTG